MDSRSPVQFSPRPRRATRRIVVFLQLDGFTALLIAGLVFSVTEVWIPLDRLHEINQTALTRIDCNPQSCDETELSSHWTVTTPDYVIDRVDNANNFILAADLPGAELAGFSLHFSDPTFIKRFSTPATVLTPAGESWRLLSEVKQVGSRPVAVMIGYTERVPWKLSLPVAQSDSFIRRQFRFVSGS
jgi:hypothetical protein